MAESIDPGTYFLFIPSVYTAAFAGVEIHLTQIGAGEKVAVTSFVTVLVVICIYTILFGRFFCGFACAFGTLEMVCMHSMCGSVKRGKRNLFRLRMHGQKSSVI